MTTKFYGYKTSPENERPVAVLATQLIDALLGSIIQLDGRKSFDPEGQPLVYKWSFTQIPTGSGLTDSSFRPLRDNDSAVAFTPDKLGLYVVRLVVNDGELDSTPVAAQVSIQLSRVPCGEGIVPDMDFLWQYISNFWNLVEDKKFISSAWSAIVQEIGADIIELWGNDYNKSIGTIQENTQRRWQKYGLTTKLISEDQRIIVGNQLYGNDSGSNGSSGTLGAVPGVGNTSVFYVPYGDISDPDKADFTRLNSNYGAQGRLIVINGQGYTISRVGVAAHPDTSDEYSLAIVDEEAIPDGLVGAQWRIPHLLHTPSFNLEEAGVRAGDVVVFEVQRKDIGLAAELRAQVVGVDRNRLGFELTLGDLSGQLVSRDLLRQLTRDLKLLPGQPTDENIAAATEALISFIPIGINLAHRPFSIFSITMKAKKIIHNTTVKISEDIVSIPALQESIYDPPAVLRENLDYIVEAGEINFSSGLFAPDSPTPEELWAECVFIDNTTAVENNFGRMVRLLKEDLSESRTRAPYLSAVKGLMYALTNSPTMANLRLSLQILMGLPFADSTGVILEHEAVYSQSPTGEDIGRLLVEDVDEIGRRTGFRKIYFYPSVVGLETNPLTNQPYRVGDIIAQWAPISKGVEVVDYIKSPTWWKSALAGLEVMKYATFRVAMDSEIFDVNDAIFSANFIKRVKPTYTRLMMAIIKSLSDDIEVEDILGWDTALKFYDNAGWGLEATAKSNDYNQQGFQLWNIGSRPFSTRSLQRLADVVTSKNGIYVQAVSTTGWDVNHIRGREAADSPYTNAPYREGDILVIFRGQPGAGMYNNGMYEIDQVIDGNTIRLLSVAAAPDPATSYYAVLDSTLFPYGSGLSCCIVRREMNPVIKGDDLVTPGSGNIVTSASALFMTNGIGVDDHLIIESGANIGEYRIDVVSGLAISETQVALKNLDGTDASFSADTDQDFRVIRYIAMDTVIAGAKTIDTGGTVEIEVLDTGIAPNKPKDTFTPGLVGTVVNVSNSQNPTNDGNYLVTAYIHPGRIRINKASTTSDTTYQSVVHLNSIWHPGFEKIDELSPSEAFELVLEGV